MLARLTWQLSGIISSTGTRDYFGDAAEIRQIVVPANAGEFDVELAFAASKSQLIWMVCDQDILVVIEATNQNFNLHARHPVIALIDDYAVPLAGCNQFGDGNTKVTCTYNGAVAANLTILILKDSTLNLDTAVEELTSSGSPSTVGDTVTFTVTVANDSGSNPPTGAVTFQEGTTVLGVGTLVTVDEDTGVATLAISSLTEGEHTVTAVYGGDTLHNGCVSDPFVQTVSA